MISLHLLLRPSFPIRRVKEGKESNSHLISCLAEIPNWSIHAESNNKRLLMKKTSQGDTGKQV